jgi:DNA methylase/Restriction endonuclease
LHCDPTASHYLKILLDAVFGKTRFQNEIIWSYRRWPTQATHFQRTHDVLLFYSKARDPGIFNILLQSPTASSQKRWRGKKQVVTFDEGGARLPTQELAIDSAGVAMNDVWTIPIIAPVSKERLGYPTQKPLALLERIISASSNEGDLVLDPFCGCGTTVHAAQKLNRRWIGIDITHLAIHLIKRRLNEAFHKIRFDISGVPKDLDGARALARQDPYEFQKWALSMIDAQPYKGGKKGGDRGVDGYLYIKPEDKKTEKVIVSVKNGHSLNPAMVKDLIVTVGQEDAKMDVFLTLEPPTRGMKTQAAAAGFYKPEGWRISFPKIQIVTVEDLFKPSNPLHLPLQDTSVFKKAKRETTEKQSELDL